MSKSKLVLSLEDVFCIACRSILIKPVTMPCSHSICEACFHSTVECNKLECPWDKKRFGSWLRRATKKKELVNEAFWATIQHQYPDEVAKRLRDEDDGVEERLLNQSGPSVQISKPGEVGEEFQRQLKEYEEQLRKEREKEEMASEEIVRQLQKEEEEKAAALQRERELMAAKDAEIARQLLTAEQTADVLGREPTLITSSSSISFSDDAVTSTPKTNTLSKTSKKRMVSSHGKGFTSSNSTISSPQENTVIGPLDSFIRPNKNASVNTSKNESGCLSTISCISDSSPEGSLLACYKKVPALNRPMTDYLKLNFSSDRELPVSGSSKEGPNQFRPIRPSPVTPTKDSPSKRIIIPQTVKPSICKSFFQPAGSTAPNKSLSFSPHKRAFAFTSTANQGNSDSETDFEDEDESCVPSEPPEISDVSELKELEEDIIRSYCEKSTQLLEPCSVRKPKQSQLQESHRANKMSLSPYSKEKMRQVNEDYELALKLQEEFDKENRRRRQVVSDYELRNKRRSEFVKPEVPGNASKKRKIETKKAGTKQRTIEEAFQMKS
nr:PREDICTED: E3 ubiquitin-protein ligase RNF168-like [Bemisia tabaci]